MIHSSLKLWFIIMLHNINLIANCGHPNELLSAVNLSVPITIEGYDGLPIVGSTIRFRCPTGLELVGDQSSAVCSQKGLWDPWASDFTDLMCTNSSGKELIQFCAVCMVSCLH